LKKVLKQGYQNKTSAVFNNDRRNAERKNKVFKKVLKQGYQNKTSAVFNNDRRNAERKKKV